VATQSKRVAVLAAAVLVPYWSGGRPPCPPAGRPAAPRSTTDNGAALLCCRSNHHAAHASLSLGLHLCLCVQPRPFRRPCVRLLRVAWHPSRGLRSLAAGQSSGWVSRRLVSLELEVSYRLPFRINKQEMDGWMGTVYMYLVDRYTCTCTVYRARTVTCQERPKWKSGKKSFG
jgi:hypothetical protein